MQAAVDLSATSMSEHILVVYGPYSHQICPLWLLKAGLGVCANARYDRSGYPLMLNP